MFLRLRKHLIPRSLLCALTLLSLQASPITSGVPFFVSRWVCFVNGNVSCSVHASALLFYVEQALVRLCGRCEGWGYLAVHRFAVVDRLLRRIDVQRRSVVFGHGQCSP